MSPIARSAIVPIKKILKSHIRIPTIHFLSVLFFGVRTGVSGRVSVDMVFSIFFAAGSLRVLKFDMRRL